MDLSRKSSDPSVLRFFDARCLTTVINYIIMIQIPSILHGMVCCSLLIFRIFWVKLMDLSRGNLPTSQSLHFRQLGVLCLFQNLLRKMLLASSYLVVSLISDATMELFLEKYTSSVIEMGSFVYSSQSYGLAPHLPFVSIYGSFSHII